jgi:hypothetical protein
MGNYCTRQVPVRQGIFVSDKNGDLRRVALANRRPETFKDFLFWVFSGRPPGAGAGDEGDAAEPPRWRSSAFVAVSPSAPVQELANEGSPSRPSVVFKGTHSDSREGLFIRQRLSSKSIKPLILVGADAADVDPGAPAGSAVTAVGVERDGFRNCHLVVNTSFLNESTSESWAGIYLERNACPK